jgi:RNA recognition motif-containing protein
LKKLYVGNLPFTSTEEDLKELFGQYGQVSSAKVITDRETGRSRGFAFVEMDSGADEAMRALDGNQFGGRPLRVNEAQERERGGRGGPRGGGGGGRY